MSKPWHEEAAAEWLDAEYVAHIRRIPELLRAALAEREELIFKRKAAEAGYPGMVAERDAALAALAETERSRDTIELVVDALERRVDDAKRNADDAIVLLRHERDQLKSKLAAAEARVRELTAFGYAAAYDNGHARGAAAERARIVSDLRENLPNAVYSSDGKGNRVTYADRYAAGAHLERPDGVPAGYWQRLDTRMAAMDPVEDAPGDGPPLDQPTDGGEGE